MSNHIAVRITKTFKMDIIPLVSKTLSIKCNTPFEPKISVVTVVAMLLNMRGSMLTLTSVPLSDSMVPFIKSAFARVPGNK